MLKKIAIALAAVVLLVLVLISPFKISSYYYQKHYSSVVVDEKIVALTFDDGPNPGETLALLDELDRLGVKATFFNNGKHVTSHPEIVLEMHRRGHEIGNHGWTHKALWQYTAATPLDEISRTTEAIQAVTGSAPRLFRPPFLVGGLGLALAVNELSLQPVGASAGAADWEEKDPKIIAQKILAGVESGGIIILHDGDGSVKGGNQQASRKPTVAATVIIIEELQQQGYRFVSIEELFALEKES